MIVRFSAQQSASVVRVVQALNLPPAMRVKVMTTGLDIDISTLDRADVAELHTDLIIQTNKFLNP